MRQRIYLKNPKYWGTLIDRDHRGRNVTPYNNKSKWTIFFNRGKIKAIDKPYNSNVNVSNMYKE